MTIINSFIIKIHFKIVTTATIVIVTTPPYKEMAKFTFN